MYYSTIGSASPPPPRRCVRLTPRLVHPSYDTPTPQLVSSLRFCFPSQEVASSSYVNHLFPNPAATVLRIPSCDPCATEDRPWILVASFARQYRSVLASPAFGLAPMAPPPWSVLPHLPSVQILVIPHPPAIVTSAASFPFLSTLFTLIHTPWVTSAESAPPVCSHTGSSPGTAS
jgi:hypothetical protein